MRAKQDREVLIIKSDSNYAEVIFHTFFLVLLCYIAMIIAISRKQLAIWQFISCLIVFTVSLRNIVDVPLFWKLEISRTPNKCVVTRRKLLSWETTTIDGFIDFGYVKGWFGYIRMTDTDWLVFIKHENGNYKLLYAVEMQSWSTKKIVEEIADYLGWGGEYREYEIIPLKYGTVCPNDTHFKNIVLAYCIIPVIELHPVPIMLGILGIAWLYMHEIAIQKYYSKGRS